MFKKYVVSFFAAIVFSTNAFAAGDSGKIVEIYAHPNGSMALRLDNGFPGANEKPENNCGVPGNTWAGIPADSPAIMKAAIFTAKVTGADVHIITLGNCVGGWLKIEAMHIR